MTDHELAQTKELNVASRLSERHSTRAHFTLQMALIGAVLLLAGDFSASHARDAADLFEDVELRSSAQSFAERLRSPFRDSDDEPLETDRPDFTEASSTIAPGRVQLESGYTFVSDRAGGISTTAHAIPQFVWRIGMTERFEMRIVWDAGYLTEREVDRGPGTVTRRSGGTDMDLGIKTALLEPDGWIPEASLITTLSVQTGADQFRSRRTQPKSNLLYGWDITENLSFAGSTGLQYLIEDGDNFTQFHQSLTTGYSFTEKLGMYVEWFAFGFAGDEEAKPQHYLDGGFTYKFTPNFQVDIRAGWGLNEAAEDFFSGVGYAIRW
jgi:Putative MetA-pathway of phenol degradation